MDEPIGPQTPNMEQAPVPPPASQPASKGKKLMLVIVIAGLLVLVGATMFLLIKDNGTDGSKNTSQNQRQENTKTKQYDLGFNHPDTLDYWVKDASNETNGIVVYSLEGTSCKATFEQVAADKTTTAAAALDTKFEAHKSKANPAATWLPDAHNTKPWVMPMSDGGEPKQQELPTRFAQYNGPGDHPYVVVVLLDWIADTQVSVTLECRGDHYYDYSQAIAYLLDSVIIGTKAQE